MFFFNNYIFFRGPRHGVGRRACRIFREINKTFDCFFFIYFIYFLFIFLYNNWDSCGCPRGLLWPDLFSLKSIFWRNFEEGKSGHPVHTTSNNKVSWVSWASKKIFQTRLPWNPVDSKVDPIESQESRLPFRSTIRGPSLFTVSIITATKASAIPTWFSLYVF